MTENHPNKAIFMKAGKTAPDFSLFNTNGHIYSLSAAETPIILVFYRGDW